MEQEVEDVIIVGKFEVEGVEGMEWRGPQNFFRPRGN